MEPPAISHPKTTQRVLELLEALDWRSAKVADVGAGGGHFSYVLGEYLDREHGLEPREHVFPCDLITETFQYERLDCAATAPDGTLPFDDDTFDAVVSIEVIEHVEDQFAFVREMARIAKPGGLVILTTPNVLNLNSRVRSLLCGFPLLFDPLPLKDQDVRYLSGHIHPVSPYFLAYGAHRAGLTDPHFHTDRTKSSAVAWAVVLSPLLFLGRAFFTGRMRHKYPDVLEQNRSVLDAQAGWTLLTGRTTILTATKP